MTKPLMLLNVAPLWGEHGSAAASTFFRPRLTSTPTLVDRTKTLTVVHAPPPR
uniref:hypothetical protein n=1 Tax=Serratia TaxID=613 RepID=UPI00146EFA8D|nr:MULTISPECIES: hypothetical protein [Serratia]